MRRLFASALLMGCLAAGHAEAVPTHIPMAVDEVHADPFVLLVDDRGGALMAVDVSIPEMRPRPSKMEQLLTVPNIGIMLLGSAWLLLARRRGLGDASGHSPA